MRRVFVCGIYLHVGLQTHSIDIRPDETPVRSGMHFPQSYRVYLWIVIIQPKGRMWNGGNIMLTFGGVHEGTCDRQYSAHFNIYLWGSILNSYIARSRRLPQPNSDQCAAYNMHTENHSDKQFVAIHIHTAGRKTRTSEVSAAGRRPLALPLDDVIVVLIRLHVTGATTHCPTHMRHHHHLAWHTFAHRVQLKWIRQRRKTGTHVLWCSEPNVRVDSTIVFLWHTEHASVHPFNHTRALRRSIISNCFGLISHNRINSMHLKTIAHTWACRWDTENISYPRASWWTQKTTAHDIGDVCDVIRDRRLCDDCSAHQSHRRNGKCAHAGVWCLRYATSTKTTTKHARTQHQQKTKHDDRGGICAHTHTSETSTRVLKRRRARIESNWNSSDPNARPQEEKIPTTNTKSHMRTHDTHTLTQTLHACTRAIWYRALATSHISRVRMEKC